MRALAADHAERNGIPHVYYYCHCYLFTVIITEGFKGAGVKGSFEASLTASVQGFTRLL